jgi:hypothetical protein
MPCYCMLPVTIEGSTGAGRLSSSSSNDRLLGMGASLSSSHHMLHHIGIASVIASSPHDEVGSHARAKGRFKPRLRARRPRRHTTTSALSSLLNTQTRILASWLTFAGSSLLLATVLAARYCLCLCFFVIHLVNSPLIQTCLLIVFSKGTFPEVINFPL